MRTMTTQEIDRVYRGLRKIMGRLWAGESHGKCCEAVGRWFCEDIVRPTVDEQLPPEIKQFVEDRKNAIWGSRGGLLEFHRDFKNFLMESVV